MIPYFDNKDYGALSFAFHIKELEDRGKDASKQYEQLFETYGPRGIRIYSLLRSEILLEEIRKMEDGGHDEKEISNRIDTLIEEGPGAIFVSKYMDRENIKKEMKSRFSSGEDEFRVFARAGRVPETKEAVKEIEEKEEDVSYNIEKQPWASGEEAIVVYIKKGVIEVPEIFGGEEAPAE